MKVEEEREKLGLKLNIQKTKIMASGPNRWGDNGNSDKLYLEGLKITADSDCSHEIKICLLFGENFNKPRQPVKKQIHHFDNKGPSSQGCGYSSSHVGCESWTIKKAEC